MVHILYALDRSRYFKVSGWSYKTKSLRGLNMPSSRGHGGFVLYWAMRLAKLLLLCRPSVTLIVWKPQ